MRGFLTLLVLTTLPAGAEPADPCQAEAEQAVEAALATLEPAMTVARETPPRSFAETFRSDGSYSLASGIIMDASCFADLTGRRAQRARARKFAATSRGMLAGMDRCATHRLLSARGFAIYDTLSARPVFQCERNRCRSRYSCRLSGQNRINLDDPESWTEHSTWFHELAHLSEQVDNVSVPEHNRREDLSQRDEVFFWERACFRPGFIVSKMRQGDPLACAALAYQPLPSSGNKPRYTDREVETVCGFFEDYLHEERGYLRGLALNLYPEIARCGDADRAAGRCLDPAVTNRALHAAIPALSAEPLPAPSSFAAWIKRECGEALAANHDYLGMKLCLETKKIALMTAVRGASDAGVTEESVQAHFDGIIARVNFLAEGPGDVTGIPRAAQGNDTSVLVEPARRCLAEEGLRGTSFCEVFAKTMLPRLGRLFVYFGDPR